jgi:2-polyprenyl-6-methoxyphenol hydroxylase-like FAD-dependent oxidoreductase
MSAQPQKQMRHAVVIGASMAGLAAARALAGHFERVSVFERDDLAEKTPPEARKGVPQGRHGHALLAAGGRVLEDYFPGLMAELVSAGASEGDATGDFLWFQFGGWKLRTPSGLRGVILTRPMLEARVRARVRGVPNVELFAQHEVDEVLHDQSLGRVTGLRVTDRVTKETRSVDADLLVDASGRGSVAPRWLAGWGYGEVAETLVKCDIGYTSAFFERRPGDVESKLGCAIAGTPPGSKRGGIALAVEGPRWQVTLFGSLGDHPPVELEGYRDFARSLPVDALHTLVKDREPLAAIHSFRYPANRRRHFERLPRFPEGFLVLGDAFCSFNPVYGQGMSVVINEALALDACLERGTERLSKRFFARAGEVTEAPWTIATGEDLRFPEVEGPRPPGFALLSRYMERVHQAATRDPAVMRRFFEVAHLLKKPTAILAPDIALRVLLNGGAAANPGAAPSPTVSRSA